MVSSVRIRAIQDIVKVIGVNKILHNADESEYFDTLYREVFGESVCTTCPGVLSNAIERLLNLSTLKIKQMADRNYTMKEGVVIDLSFNQIIGVPVHVSNVNLTDEVAEKILKSNPNYKNQIFKMAGEEKAVKAEIAAEKKGYTLEQAMDMTKPELKKALQIDEIPFDDKAGKEELAKLLIAGK